MLHKAEKYSTAELGHEGSCGGNERLLDDLTALWQKSNALHSKIMRRLRFHYHWILRRQARYPFKKKKKKFSNMKEKTTSPFPICLQGDCVKFCI